VAEVPTTGYEPKNSEVQRIMEQRRATQEESEQLAADPAWKAVMKAEVMDLAPVALYLASATESLEKHGLILKHHNKKY